MFNKYLAKSDGTTIQQHNNDLIKILNSLNVTEETYKNMIKVINMHDLGKIKSDFQNQLNGSSYSLIRHEIVSASVKDLTTEQRLAILTHHKPIIGGDLVNSVYDNMDLYKSDIKEVEEKTGIEMVNIYDFMLKESIFKTNLSNKKAIKLKGLLNICDHLASGGNISKFYRGIESHKIYNFDKLTSVQKEIQQVDEDVILVSSTGSGKTEASLYWAENVNDGTNPIFYLLPFTSSIGAMYKRLEDDGFETGMLHSKAKYYLYKNLKNVNDANIKHTNHKYYKSAITVQTIFQAFKPIYNCRFNEIALANYKDSIFIIDEIHSYDLHGLSMILRGLKYLKREYNIKICIMSASIPSSLLALIQKELGIKRIIKQDVKELRENKRHIIHYRDMYIEHDIELIKSRLARGEKVLVCVNTVKKSQEIYNKLKYLVDREDRGLLHSRFTVKDRELIEQDLKNKKLLVGTQTIEVSLDIDYDVLFTEVSPLDSQFQRWGRVNRKRVEDLTGRSDIFVYDVNFDLYKNNELYGNQILTNRTIEVIKEIGEFDESKTQVYLDYVYADGIDEDNYRTNANRKTKIFNNCKLGIWDGTDYVKDTGYTVIPASLEDEYLAHIDKKEYYEASSLYINISNSMFEKFERSKLIKHKKKYIVLDCEYNNQMGLIDRY